MSEPKKCEACGGELPPDDDTVYLWPADRVCGECYQAGIVWAARQARRAQSGGHDIDPATGLCRICRTRPAPMPAVRPASGRPCGRPDCPVCGVKPAAVVEGP